ncbi:MAG: fibronectin type III domain-containing protein [Candidatus Paceibacterota bacterium]
MNKFLKNLIYLLVAVVLTVGFSTQANATVVSSVQFEKTPLFSEVKFAPGDSVSRFVKLNNTTSSSHRVILKTKDVVKEGNLSDAVGLVIKNGETVLYDNTFSDLFSRSELILPEVPAGTEARFDFIATFKPESANEYQNSKMDFSLQIGFEDGEMVNDTVAVGGQIGGGGGGGGSNGPIVSGLKNLIISNESISSANPPQPTTAVITWDTNMPATSQVIYGLASNGPYNLDLSQSNLGYPYQTEENTTKVLSHSVLISNLIPEQTYSYRVVSRASPPTVSYEHTFKLDKNGVIQTNSALAVVPQIQTNEQDQPRQPQNNENAEVNGFRAIGGVSGVIESQDGDDISTSTIGTSTNETSNQDLNNLNTAAAVFAGGNFLSWKLCLWILLIVALIWFFFYFKRKKDQK